MRTKDGPRTRDGPRTKAGPRPKSQDQGPRELPDMNDAAAEGLGQRRGAIVHVELQEDALHVRARGVAADPERRRRSPCCASPSPAAPAPGARATSATAAWRAPPAPPRYPAESRAARRALRESRESGPRARCPSAGSRPRRPAARGRCPRRRDTSSARRCGRRAAAWRIARIACRPFMRGNCRSISVTSGRCRRNCSTASSPLLASATTVMSGCRPTMRMMPSRIRR